MEKAPFLAFAVPVIGIGACLAWEFMPRHYDGFLKDLSNNNGRAVMVVDPATQSSAIAMVKDNKLQFVKPVVEVAHVAGQMIPIVTSNGKSTSTTWVYIPPHDVFYYYAALGGQYEQGLAQSNLFMNLDTNKAEIYTLSWSACEQYAAGVPVNTKFSDPKVFSTDSSKKVVQDLRAWKEDNAVTRTAAPSVIQYQRGGR